MNRLLRRGLPLLVSALAMIGLFVGVQPAHAAPTTWNPISWDGDSTQCVTNYGDTAAAGSALILEPCYSPGTAWGPSPSSYAPNTYSIVSHNISHGEMCIEDSNPGFDGAMLKLEGCNGSAAQAWKWVCDNANDYTIMDGYGQAFDLYGGRDVDGTYIVAWHLYDISGGNDLPLAEQWYGPWDSEPNNC